MRKIGDEIQDLLEKYGRCKIVNREENVPRDHFDINNIPSGACVIVRTEKDEFVLIRHHRFPKVWNFPCGKREKNETFEEAAIREVLEETGLSIKITGLYAIHNLTEKSLNNEARSYSYPVFFGKIISGELSSKSSETLEIRTFKKIPKNFVLRKYYEDL